MSNKLILKTIPDDVLLIGIVCLAKSKTRSRWIDAVISQLTSKIGIKKYTELNLNSVIIDVANNLISYLGGTFKLTDSNLEETVYEEGDYVPNLKGQGLVRAIRKMFTGTPYDTLWIDLINNKIIKSKKTKIIFITGIETGDDIDYIYMNGGMLIDLIIDGAEEDPKINTAYRQHRHKSYHTLKIDRNERGVEDRLKWLANEIKLRIG